MKCKLQLHKNQKAFAVIENINPQKPKQTKLCALTKSSFWDLLAMGNEM